MNTTTRSTNSHIPNKLIYAVLSLLLLSLIILDLFIGKYPLTIASLISGDAMQWRVFIHLRLSRMLVGLIGGFVLGITGFSFQTVFKNPLASPDIIGISSGASAGAAAGILFFGSFYAVTISSFAGAMIALLLTLALAAIDYRQHQLQRTSTIVLAGIAIHALSQTVLMILKLAADPERELAAIEYWIMGSLNGISFNPNLINLILAIICVIILFFLSRQLLLLSIDEGEARMLGVNVPFVRFIVLFLSTLACACIISMTGLISFIGLLAPHIARLLIKEHSKNTLFASGFIGAILLCAADILARSITATELPVSIFTSLLGAPFLIMLVLRRNRS